MSILEKLKDLVVALESGETQEKAQENSKNVEEVEDIEPSQPEYQAEEVPSSTPPMQPLSVNEPQQEEIEEFPSYLECTIEESLEVSMIIANTRKAKLALADLVVEHEKRKSNLLNFIEENSSDFYKKLESLRLEYGIPRDGYSVQLPTSQEDKVTFIKN